MPRTNGLLSLDHIAQFLAAEKKAEKEAKKAALEAQKKKSLTSPLNGMSQASYSVYPNNDDFEGTNPQHQKKMSSAGGRLVGEEGASFLFSRFFAHSIHSHLHLYNLPEPPLHLPVLVAEAALR